MESAQASASARLSGFGYRLLGAARDNFIKYPRTPRLPSADFVQASTLLGILHATPWAVRLGPSLLLCLIRRGRGGIGGVHRTLSAFNLVFSQLLSCSA